MRRITIDGTKIHDVADLSISYMVYQPIEGIGSAPQRMVEFNRVGENGTYIPNVYQGERLITLKGRVISKAGDNYWMLRHGITALSVPRKGSSGLLQQKVFDFVDDLGNEYTVKGQVSNLVLSDEYVGSASFSMDLRCSQWYLSSASPGSVSLITVVDGGVILPVIAPVILETSSTNVGSLNNTGDTSSYPSMTFTGPLTNPRMANTTTGAYIGFSFTLSATDTLTVDTENRTASLNGGSAMQYLVAGSTFWTLASGINSLIFTSSSGSDTGTGTVSFYPAWSGM